MGVKGKTHRDQMGACSFFVVVLSSVG